MRIQIPVRQPLPAMPWKNTAFDPASQPPLRTIDLDLDEASDVLHSIAEARHEFFLKAIDGQDYPQFLLLPPLVWLLLKYAFAYKWPARNNFNTPPAFALASELNEARVYGMTIVVVPGLEKIRVVGKPDKEAVR